MMCTAVVIIPARYASTRLPGKLLKKDPSGKYLLQHTYEAARKARRISRVIVGTDDSRIYDAVRSWRGEVVMTSPDHPSGSDRVAEVARGAEADIVVNVQGDEPQIRPDMIDHVVRLLLDDSACDVSTLANEIDTQEELADPNAVKVVLDAHDRALYFSRFAIPFVRDSDSPFKDSPLPHLKHLGIYGYRRESLLRLAALPPAPVERAEKLEQLRALYHGLKIKVGVTPYHVIGVDTQADFDAFVASLSVPGIAQCHERPRSDGAARG